MSSRKNIYNELRLKMEKYGFQFETEQQPHLQNRKETELKFIHPQLIKKFKSDAYNVKATKFYIKPLTDAPDCEIGFVTGKTSPLYTQTFFSNPNSSDPYDDNPAWINRDNDAALDNLLMSIGEYLGTNSNITSKNMNTFLLTWNASNWDWRDLKENIKHLETVGSVESRWSCSNSKLIKKGDRVFLMKLGEEPKGIMASGYAKSSYYAAPHWDGTKDKLTNYISVEFDILIDYNENKLFDKKYFESIDPNKKQKWFPQQSGISIKTEVVGDLESSWFNFIRENKYITNSFVSNDVIINNEKTFIEGKSMEITQTRYERNPEARRRCLEKYGFTCMICGFDFENIYGKIGTGFIHVHHINQISDIGKEYEVDPTKDLIPVCPNCHAMIHSKRPALTIAELKEIINKKAEL